MYSNSIGIYYIAEEDADRVHGHSYDNMYAPPNDVKNKGIEKVCL